MESLRPLRHFTLINSWLDSREVALTCTEVCLRLPLWSLCSSRFSVTLGSLTLDIDLFLVTTPVCILSLKDSQHPIPQRSEPQ